MSLLKRRIRLKRKEYRFGKGAKCAFCEEIDLRSLDFFRGQVVCRNCRLAALGSSGIEKHHFSGRQNDAFLIALPANEHAILSDCQQDWPEETLKNPNKKFLLELAAWLRALGDFREHVIERGPILADQVERLSQELDREASSKSSHKGSKGDNK